MKYPFHLFVFVILVSTASCRTSRSSDGLKKDDGKFELVFIQVNDVYEIAPIAGGKMGGMARVAALKKQYKSSNPNTLLVMAGDFVSPSVYNSLQYEGKRIRGKQMIEAMNAAGTDLAVFGNHEFDINEGELQERINESQFQWVASNTFHKKNGIEMPFKKVHNNDSSSLPKSYIATLHDADGTTVRIGFIGLTLPFNKADYVSYTDPLETARQIYSSLKDSCDAVVAITHQSVEEDSVLAQQLPGLTVILGGHEHDMQFRKIGNIYITKAHANARSAYVVRLMINKKNRSVKVTPELKMLDESVFPDSATNVIVKKWMDIGDQNYASLGFDARQIVIKSGETLDGRETEVRSRSTNLSRMILDAMDDACADADVVMYNAGSIRLDDLLTPPVTQYDIIRSLPFGGGIREAEMKGKLLVQTLEAGSKNSGIGGYLHYKPVIHNAANNNWTINGAVIDPEKVYKIAISDFLVTGKEANLGFLNKDNPDMLKLNDPVTATNDSRSDIRLAIVRYLQKRNL
ncbi:MAG: 5'-nucleotidase C-terminal domain-containing protein [Chitinophagaceae bacterium]